MASALIANIAVFVAILVVGFAVEREVRSDAKLYALPWYLQWLVGGLAISPIVYLEDGLGVGPIDGLVVAFAISAVFWIILPVVLSGLVDHDGMAASGRC